MPIGSRTLAFKRRISSPTATPIRIQFEDFRAGSGDPTYYDTSLGNSGGASYRPDTNVDIETSSDIGGGYNLSYVNSGEWLTYDLVVPVTGIYDIKIRYASGGPSATYTLSIDSTVVATFDVLSTGGWQNWQTAVVSGVALTAGAYVARLDVVAGGTNLNWFEIETPGNSPVRIQAEDFKAPTGTYYDTSAGNSGGAPYRPDTNVDIETTSDIGGGFNVAWTSPGEWLTYDLTIPTTGTYSITLRYASGGPSATYTISLGAGTIATFNVSSTGGWQNWQSAVVSGVSLTAGTYVMRFDIVSGGTNLNWIEFVQT